MKHTVHEISLLNGIKGLFIHCPDASVMSFELNFRAGEYLVKKEKWETPHLMEHVLLGANELLPKSRLFQAEFEKNGAYNNASTGSYDITYEAECADFEWDRIVDLLLIAITKPLFLEEEFEAEFGNVREELTARSNNHFRHLSLGLRQAYGFKVMTDQQRLQLMENVKIDDIRRHYYNTHTSKNLRFVIAGNLPPDRRKLLQTLLENVELPLGDARLELPHEQPVTLKKPLYIHNDTVENVYFYVDTFMQRRMEETEVDALSLINMMLTETLYSRILGTARERGLVYGMSSGFGQTKDSSNWWFGAQVMPKNATALFDIIERELQLVFEAQVADKDVTSAKQYALGRYQRSGQTVGGTAGGYSGRYFFDEAVDDYYKIPERIEAVTKERIVQVSRQMFDEKVWGMGALGSCGEDFAQTLQQQVRPLWQQPKVKV
ncbi:MAG TPA: insulinase family protein [Verrucomicrobiae bacterium]|nr:insulinase family protein [Verrucomicrobiae bacterium]